jgi:phosphinothricin acetyltransferase
MSQIRAAGEDDVPAIRDIYNEAIRTTTATFDQEEKSLQDRMDWFHRLNEGYPVIVAERGGQVAGFAAMQPYSERGAYRHTGAVAIYVDSRHRRQGIGRALLAELLRRSREETRLHTALALICAENEPSIRLHEAFGFEEVGRIREVGVKFGRVLDVVFLQKMLAPLPEDLT